MGPDRLERPRPFPSNRALAAAAVVTGLIAFLLRLEWPAGRSVLALQLGYFASYVVLFLAGCFGAKGHWLESIPHAQMKLWLKVSVGAAIALVAVLLAAKATQSDVGRASGGWNGLAAFYAFWEPLFAWGIILGLLVVFQQRFVVLSATWSLLARRAYLIFIIHPPVLVAVSLALCGVAIPALVKFVLSGSAACAISFVFAGFLLRIPALQRVV